MKRFERLMTSLRWMCFGIILTYSWYDNDRMAWRWVWITLVALGFELAVMVVASFVLAFRKGLREHGVI